MVRVRFDVPRSSVTNHVIESQVPVADSVWTQIAREPLERRLRRHLEGEVRFDPASRALYATDASHYQILPLGVVIPKTPADLMAAVAIAMEQHVPIVPRGGGTSLSGQSIGAGLVLDLSKYLDRVVEIDAEARWVRVQPGIVLARLNEYLAPMGMRFGPDVATSDRANLGGMIGNNSAGARSIKYGKTVDHVLELEVILADGRAATLKALAGDELAAALTRPGREGEIYRVTRGVVTRLEAEIREKFPRILRRVSGYNLDALVPPADFNLAKLVVGSEGTLAVVTEAKLAIVERPRHVGLAVVHYDSLEDALKSLGAILATGPSAVELIDQMILDLARRNPQFRGRIDFVEGQPAAIFLVEYSADEPGEVGRRLDALSAALAGVRHGPILATEEPARRARIWNVRKTALPLLHSLPGQRKPITFVEDTAVDPARLPEFVARFKEILRAHGTHGSFYGHASVGCLHIRPLLDLGSAEGPRAMLRIAEEVVELVREFGGAMSGEHGDGLARSMFNRRLFGNAVYEGFLEVKRGFDPDNLLNPGKVVNGPPMTENLRGAAGGADPAIVSRFAYAREGGPLAIVRQCNGNGLCRRTGVGTMCPSFIATHEEDQSPRGRANLLRAALEGRLGVGGAADWAEAEGLDAALDACVQCKACKTECPSAVDIAKLKSEYLYQRGKFRRRAARERLIADLPNQNRLGARLAPFSNLALRAWPTRWLLDRFLGMDRRRKIPSFHRRTLLDWFRRHEPMARRPQGMVVLLADCFTNYQAPHIGRDAVSLLELAGYQVYLAPLCCGRAMISKGFLDEAEETIRLGARRLFPYAEDGIPILGLEPSCLLTLVDEWPDLAPGEATTAIALQARLLETWLVDRVASGAAPLSRVNSEPPEVLLHGHCHQKAAGALAGTTRALQTLAGVEPVVLDAGCCGMAGSFGYEKEHYDLSVTMFNDRLLPALRQAPAASVVAPGFSCRCQIADLTRRRALHPVELIRRRVVGGA